MTSRSLAKAWLKYWSKDHNGNWELATNAPAPLWLAVKALPSTITRNMAHEAMDIIAGAPAAERSLGTLLDWIKSHPQAVAHCDKWLADKGKQGPRKFTDLLEKAYSAEMQIARNTLEQHLTTHINEHF